MPIRIKQRLHPVYFIGDSHSAIFNYLLFESEQELILGKSLIQHNLSLEGLIDVQGELNPKLQAAMRQEQLIQKEGQAPDPLSYQGARALMRQSELPPILVLFCGHIDLFLLMQQFGYDYDIVLPDFELSFESERSTSPQNISLAELRAQIQPVLSKLMVGLQWLKQRKFRILLHEIPPPYCEEELLQEKSGFTCPLDTRLRLSYFFNQEIQKVAQQYQVPFLSLWNDITEKHVLRPEYVLDGLHLNRRAAELSLEKIAEHCLLTTTESSEQERDRVAQIERLYDANQLSEIPMALEQEAGALPDADQLMFKGPEEQRRWGQLRLHQIEALGSLQRWQEALEIQREYADILRPLLQSGLFRTSPSPSQLPPPTESVEFGLWFAGQQEIVPIFETEDLESLGLQCLFIVSSLDETDSFLAAWQAQYPQFQIFCLSPATFNAPRWQKCLKFLRVFGWQAEQEREDLIHWQYLVNLSESWTLRYFLAEATQVREIF